MFCFYLIFVLLSVFCKSEDVGPRFLTSSYSQVSHLGSMKTHVKQAPWTYSSNVHNVKVHNPPIQIKSNQRLSLNKKFDDGTGEVQERFNPRPWFAYESAVNKEPEQINVPFKTFSPSQSNNKNKPSSLLEPPYQNETFSEPLEADSPPTNTYGSSYNSYNPKSPAESSNSGNFVTPTSEQEDIRDDYSNASELESNSNGSEDMNLSAPAYNPDHINAPSTNNFPPGIPEYLENDPYGHGYNFNHDHPIYYQVTTTTEAPENQRLNKRPYSYYYIGRKLWYIPLYFSVYFIIYIFVLILKSIARHKISFNHYFEQDKREMKDEHQVQNEHIHELEHHVLADLGAARRKYIM